MTALSHWNRRSVHSSIFSVHRAATKSMWSTRVDTAHFHSDLLRFRCMLPRRLRPSLTNQFAHAFPVGFLVPSPSAPQGQQRTDPQEAQSYAGWFWDSGGGGCEGAESP